ncbi:HetZ-related protein [Prochlorothrix hollandica]|uniref:HetZ-related protein n=1 Tax=Prochlorothrix hollandica TaxID=1223 RepID=UPI0003492C31|nr:HetZ-related protein [Prochlorothrix hollandica]
MNTNSKPASASTLSAVPATPPFLSTALEGTALEGTAPDPSPNPANPAFTSPVPAIESPALDVALENTDETVVLEDITGLMTLLRQELEADTKKPTTSSQAVSERIAKEVTRICAKSNRIQNSGEVANWKLTLGRHRLKKCLGYYKLGSRRGRVELHSTLSTIVYRHVARLKAQLGFHGRHALIEDFLQGFYIEVLKVFRRENHLPEDYCPKTRLELAEYMAFTEQYAKRRINLPGRANQQIIVLRSQNFARRQPQETLMDIEAAMESPKREEGEAFNRSPLSKHMREQMVADAVDPAEAVVRDRVLSELVKYLESQGHSDCVDYLALRLQDLPAPEIDEILGLSARQRDYLQQRFKYHVEKFSRLHQWELVHHWLGADLSQNLGLSPRQWQSFLGELDPAQQDILRLKQTQLSEATGTHLPSDQDIAQRLKCTPKQLQRRWYQILALAWKVRNEDLKDLKVQ